MGPARLESQRLLEERTVASPVRRLPDRAEAHPLRKGELRGERPTGNVPLRLEKKQPAPRAQGVVQLLEKPLTVANLVEDVDDDGEVDDSGPRREAEVPVDAGDGLDPFQEPRATGATGQAFDHLRLEIHGDHPARRARHPRERQREVAHAAARLQDGHSGVHVIAEERLRPLEETAQGAAEEMPGPGGADVAAARGGWLGM
jgi:hypothetical protein